MSYDYDYPPATPGFNPHLFPSDRPNSGPSPQPPIVPHDPHNPMSATPRSYFNPQHAVQARIHPPSPSSNGLHFEPGALSYHAHSEFMSGAQTPGMVPTSTHYSGASFLHEPAVIDSRQRSPVYEYHSQTYQQSVLNGSAVMDGRENYQASPYPYSTTSPAFFRRPSYNGPPAVWQDSRADPRLGVLMPGVASNSTRCDLVERDWLTSLEYYSARPVHPSVYGDGQNLRDSYDSQFVASQQRWTTATATSELSDPSDTSDEDDGPYTPAMLTYPYLRPRGLAMPMISSGATRPSSVKPSGKPIRKPVRKPTGKPLNKPT